MKTLQITATANDEIIEQLKVAIEGVFGQFNHQKNNELKTQVEIINPILNEPIQKVVENDALFGIFSHYVKEPLTQDDIDDCLAESGLFTRFKNQTRTPIYIDWEKYDIFDKK